VLLVDRLALLGLLFFEDRGEHGEDLVQAQRHGVVGVAHEAGDAGGVPDGAPGGVRQVHADQDVAGDADAVDDLALGVLDLNDFLHGHLDFEDVIFHVQGLDAGLQVGLHAVFVTGVGVDDVPVTFLAAQLGLELLGGVNVGLGGGSGEGVGGLFLGAGVVCLSVVGIAVIIGLGVVIGLGVAGFGRGGLNLRLVTGVCRDVRGLFQLSLGYLELLLRHLVSCFLIA
jgi:hypothetical protein